MNKKLLSKKIIIYSFFLIYDDRVIKLLDNVAVTIIEMHTLFDENSVVQHFAVL
jgi:hypothetical protein